MLHAEPFETHLLSSELCVLFIYFLKGNCIGLEYHIILSKIHIIVIIKTKIIDQNKSCSNNKHVPYAKRKKLDRSKVILLLGYHKTGSYKLYCLISKKVEFRRDVIVKESE